MATTIIDNMNKRPNLNFYEMGMKVGDVLRWIDNENVKVVVESENKILYNDISYSLSAITELLKGYSTNPCPCWRYNDKSLSDIYDSTYGTKKSFAKKTLES